MARVKLVGLTKRFGDVVAVNDLDLDIKDKELMVLLGPSGCGKTTTLRCIAGLETPDEGEIYIDDTLVNDLPPKDRDIAMVFQSYALYPHMTVFSNIAFPLKVRKTPKSEIESRVKKTTALLGIGHLLDRKPKQLSGGEMQRTAVGRAIVREPKVFLMDEPLSNLDAKLRLHMRTELKRLCQDLGITTVYVTHDQIEAMTLADRMLIMREGVTQQLGSPEEVYDTPLNLFVAGFIGSPPMNFKDCTFVEKEGACCLDLEFSRLPLSDADVKIIKEQATGSELIMGIRPEDIMVQEGGGVGEWTIEGEVYVVEALGSDLLINVMCGGTIFKVMTTRSRAAAPRSGEKIRLTFKRDNVHLFDKKTEKPIIST